MGGGWHVCVCGCGLWMGVCRVETKHRRWISRIKLMRSCCDPVSFMTFDVVQWETSAMLPSGAHPSLPHESCPQARTCARTLSTQTRHTNVRTHMHANIHTQSRIHPHIHLPSTQPRSRTADPCLDSPVEVGKSLRGGFPPGGYGFAPLTLHDAGVRSAQS